MRSKYTKKHLKRELLFGEKILKIERIILIIILIVVFRNSY